MLNRPHEPHSRYRSWNHQFLHGHHGRRRAGGHSQRGRCTHDAVRRRFHKIRRASRRPGRQAPGGHQSAQHRFLREAFYRPQILRGEGRGEEHAVQNRRGQKWRRLHRGSGRRQDGAVRAAADRGVRAREAEGRCRGVSRRESHAGGHHSSRLLQRLAAPGDQGRRQDRGSRSAPHHQRADGRIARVWPRQEEGRKDCGVRLGRRHVRRLGPRNRRRRFRGQSHQRRHAPRRRQLGRSAHHLARRHLQKGKRHRSAQGPDGAPATEGRGRKGEDRPLVHAVGRHQSAVYHGGRVRPEASQCAADAREDGADLRSAFSAAAFRPSRRVSRTPSSRPRKSTSSCSSVA